MCCWWCCYLLKFKPPTYNVVYCSRVLKHICLFREILIITLNRCIFKTESWITEIFSFKKYLCAPYFTFTLTTAYNIHLPPLCVSLCPGGRVASPPGPLAPECGLTVGFVLPVSGPAAALCLEQTLHPRVHHPHLLPHLLPTPHYCCRWGSHQPVI